MKKSIEHLGKRECYGCSACQHTCPVKAIDMKQDKEGFWYPVVNNDLCIECGKCTRVCPSIQGKKTDNTSNPECYALQAPDSVRKSGSASGGAFVLLAEAILEQGGVVCGVVMDKQFKVYHTIVDNKQALQPLRGSKYVQSDLRQVFPEIKKYLSKGKKVLFTGTPCQVAGLKNYIGSNPENLLTVDLVCHGPTSQLVFERYLEENFGKENVEKFLFRPKAYGYNGVTCEVTLKNGKKYVGHKDFDVLEQGLFHSLCLRQTCENCVYAELPRIGDFTMGDFWGLRFYKPELTSPLGTSVLLVNNEKARDFLKLIAPKCKLLEQTPFKAALRNRFRSQGHAHPERERFFEMLSYTTMNKAVTYCMHRRYDVGILGIWYGTGYGSIATYYGLAKVLEKMGLSVLMIEKPGIQKEEKQLQAERPSRIFAEKHLHVSSSYSLENMHMLNQICDIFVVGSNQVWNYGVGKSAGRSFMLDFARNEKKKLSIASSFGHSVDFRGELDQIIDRMFLKQFDAVSVREDSAVGLCKSIFGVQAERILDPVFLAGRQIYDSLTRKLSIPESEPYIFSYILDPTPEKEQALEYIRKKTGKKVITVFGESYAPGMEENWGSIPENISFPEWINYVKNSSYIFTDSCQGMNFSVLYQKPFVIAGNLRRGMTRFHSFLKLIHLENHLLKNPTDIKTKEGLLDSIDYTEINRILKKEKERSLKWIHNAVFSPKATTEYQVFDAEITSPFSVQDKHVPEDSYYKRNLPVKIIQKIRRKSQSLLEDGKIPFRK